MTNSFTGSVISHYPSNSTRQDSPLIHSQHNSSITTRANGPPSPVQFQMTTFDSQVPLTFNEASFSLLIRVSTTVQNQIFCHAKIKKTHLCVCLQIIEHKI